MSTLAVRMFRRSRKPAVSPDLARAIGGVRLTAGRVEEARSALLLAVPSGRAPRLPLAEALAAFEAGLRDARDGLDAWRGPQMEAEWRECDLAIAESLRRAERLRLAGAPDGYEQLAPILDDLLEPLSALGRADLRVRALGG
jgi:hypothetical protein